MGEAAAPCLMRSVSHPLFGFKEGDRLRALTTSVSFGRFMNEPLDWERWSSFSHNRTLEDVKKYSRPGAVAEKKAFFEAYYKNLAPPKKAKPPKTDINEENKPTNIVVEPVNDTVSSACQAEQEKTSTENVCLPSTNLGFSETAGVDDIISGTCQVAQEKTSTENVNLVPSHNVVKPETTFNKNVCLPSTTNLGFSEVGDVKDETLNNRGVELEISSNEDVGLPRANILSSENTNVDDTITKTSTENVSSIKNLNHVEKNKKNQMKTKTEISRVKSSTKKTPPISEIRHKNAAAMPTEKKKSVLQSLHSSIKFPASLNKSLNLNTFIKPKDRPIPQPLTRVSSVNGVKNTSQVLPRPEHKRSNPLLSCSLNGSKATVLMSVSINHSEASIVSTTKKPRSATVFSSFSFKSDERAAKRKEFFQKLEEKVNINKTEKTRLQPKLKEKGNKKLPWGGVPQAKTSTIIQKVPPKLVKKNFIEINKKNLSSSMACLPSKKLHDYSTLMLKK